MSAAARYRYYLTEGDSPEREVTKAQFVSAERRAGFTNTTGEPDEPATGGFSRRYGDTKVGGRVEFAGEGEPVPLTPAAAAHACQAAFDAIAYGKIRVAALVLRDLEPEHLTELAVICGDVQIMVEAEQRRREEQKGKQ